MEEPCWTFNQWKADMNFNARSNQNVRDLEPLPSGFSHDLRAVDEELAEHARQSPAPEGLCGRVFLASVEKLPSQLALERRLKFPFATLAARRGVWGQLAMAASVALAFGIALWFVQGPHTKPPVKLVRTDDSDARVSLAAALRPLSADPAPFESDFSYLLETNDLTSADEITSELVMLVRELEM